MMPIHSRLENLCIRCGKLKVTGGKLSLTWHGVCIIHGKKREATLQYKLVVYLEISTADEATNTAASSTPSSCISNCSLISEVFSRIKFKVLLFYPPSLFNTVCLPSALMITFRAPHLKLTCRVSRFLRSVPSFNENYAYA